MKMHGIKEQWDRALALLAAAVGALALVLGWVGVSGVSLKDLISKIPGVTNKKLESVR